MPQQGFDTPRIPIPLPALPIPNLPAPPQGFATPKTLVAPQMLPVPNQPAPQPAFVAPQPAFGAWPNQPATQPSAAAWPNQPAPQQGHGSWSPQPATQPGLGNWSNLRAPQQWSSAPATVDPVLKRKRKGLGVVAWSLWVFAGGLFAAPQLADYADRGVEDGIAWLATSAPSFVRPYLPKLLEAPAPAPVLQHLRDEGAAPAVPSAVATAEPAEATGQPQPKRQIVVQPAGTNAPATDPSPKPVAVERPAKEARHHAVRGTHGKVAAALAVAEPPAPVAAAKPTEHKHGASGDPFESFGDGASEPATTRVAQAAVEPAAVKSQPTRSHDSLDDLMGDGGSVAGKPHDKRNTSKEIDAMLKDVQKSDPQPPPKRTEAATAAPSLTAADIARVMTGVKNSAAECGKRFGQNGVADLKLTVGRDGRISGVAVRGKLADSPVGRCVAQAARDAVFPHNSGLTFDYRIDVR